MVVTWRARLWVQAVAASSRHDSRLCAGFAPVIQVEYTNARTEHRRPSLTQRATKDFTSVLRAREEKTGLMPSEPRPDLSPKSEFCTTISSARAVYLPKSKPRRQRQKVNLRPTHSLPGLRQTRKNARLPPCALQEETRPSHVP